MSIFGVTAFADVQAPGGTVYKYSVTKKNGYIIYTNFLPTVSDGKMNISGVLYSGESYIGSVTGTLLSASDYFSSTGMKCTISGGGFTSIVEDNGNIDVIPPEMAPTVKEAIAKIVPDLSTQLKILLPVGVTILSIMLGVSLVKRLVHLFL